MDERDLRAMNESIINDKPQKTMKRALVLATIFSVVTMCIMFYSGFRFLFRNEIYTKHRAVETWIYKAEGQHVDTVWIYKFQD
jgi:hypothetical protein